MNAPAGLLVPSGAILGDATEMLARLPAGFADMAYIDPPFGNRKVWSGKAGKFDDRWRESEQSRAGWAALAAHNPAAAALCATFPLDGHSRGYLGFIAGLLLAVRRALKPTGSCWLHFDDTMGAYLRILGDAVFGFGRCLGLVIWKRTAAHSSKTRGWARIHDTIAVFPRSPATAWRLHRCASGSLVAGDPALGRLRVDGFCDDLLNPTSRERVGYPTQKPVALISRFIEAATVPGDLVLDPTCGSGTTLVAAARLGRRALGIDVSIDAVSCATERLARKASL